MSILDGHKVETDEINLARHRFIGTWRPPIPPTLDEINAMPDTLGNTCTCGAGFYLRTMDYLGMIRRHWLDGCFDEARYMTIIPAKK